MSPVEMFHCISHYMTLFISAVKRFPRKSRNAEDGTKESPSQSTNRSSKRSLAKSKRAKSNGRKDPPESVKRESSPLSSDVNGTEQERATNLSESVIMSPRSQPHGVDNDLLLADTDLVNVRFKMSPSEAMMYLQSASTSMPQLFKYDSMDNIHEKTSVSLAQPQQEVNNSATEGSNQSYSGTRLPSLISVPILSSYTTTNAPGASDRQTCAGSTTQKVSGSISNSNNGDADGCSHYKGGVVVPGKRGPTDEVEREEGLPHLMLAHRGKKQCMEGSMGGGMANLGQSHYHSSQRSSSLSTPPITPLTPITPSHPHGSTSSQPSSRIQSPEPMCQGGNTMSAYNSPYVTPHDTPAHTPQQSPLNSPTHISHPPPGSFHHARGPPTSHPIPASLLGAASVGGGPLADRSPGDGGANRGGPITSSCGSPSSALPTGVGHFSLSSVSRVHLQPPPAPNPGENSGRGLCYV